MRGEVLLGDVLEQGTADAERPASERHLDFALRFNFSDAVAEELGNVCWIEWCIN